MDTPIGTHIHMQVTTYVHACMYVSRYVCTYVGRYVDMYVLTCVGRVVEWMYPCTNRWAIHCQMTSGSPSHVHEVKSGWMNR